MNLSTAWQLLRRTASEFMSDKAMRLGAALAFYTALSLSPLLLIVISIVGMIYGEGAARGELVEQLRQMIGDEGARMIETMLAASSQKGTGIWATIIGIGTLLVGATGVFAQLQDSLNTVWNVKPQETGEGIWGMIKDRLLSFSLVCGLAFLLLVSLVVSAVMGALGDQLHRLMPGSVPVVRVLNFILPLLLMFLMFAMIFKVLPYARPQWSDVWVGAGLTTILFAVGKHAIGFYLGYAAVGSTFGAAGSFVVLLVWLYYSSLILLFGAEFTQVYASTLGSGISKANAGQPSQTGPGSQATEHSVPSPARPATA